MNDCGSLNYQGGVCNSATIFCIWDSVGVENLSSPVNVDSSFICWDDGTVQKFAGIFPGCIKHFYNYDNTNVDAIYSDDLVRYLMSFSMFDDINKINHKSKPGCLSN